MDHHLPIILIGGLVLLALFAAGYIGIKTKIPSVVLFIILGMAVTGVFTDTHLLQLCGEIGIILLFFILGMEFPITRLAGIAKKVAPAGILDVALNFGVTIFICYLFSADWVTCLVIGGIVYTTSSSITAKLLENTKRMANKESEFILGLLIFEDLVAPIIVAVLVGLTSGNELAGIDYFIIIAKIIGMTLVAVFLGKVVFKRLEKFVDVYIQTDIFILLTIGIALSYGGLALYLGLSEVLGAFLAGIMLAEVKRSEVIEHTLLPTRDLLMPVFFLYFGTTITLSEGIPMIPMLVTLLLWSIIAKVLVGIIGGRLYGLPKNVALRAGLSLTARGEFSVIVASLAVGTVKIFGGVYILLSAVIGIVLFMRAPSITNKIYPKQKKARPTLEDLKKLETE